jgi:hypothetical protein
MLHTFTTQKWNEHFPDSTQEQAINNLEDGQILYFPQLTFSLSPEEQFFLSPDYADPHAKNISYNIKDHKLWGVQHLSDSQHNQLKAMLDRYSRYAHGLIQNLLPRYAQQMMIGRTSFRPVQISNRKTSYRKDDKRLHVDAFPSAPNQGKRILRVFCNINPNGEDRVWRVGEPFEKVANHFLHQIGKPFPCSAALLRMLRITKSYRTLYDHYMLQMHNRMKADEHYQKNCAQQELRLPPGSTWIVQTDHVSHAAMSGQHLLEQTFYLPVKAMKDETKSPLRVLEKILRQKLA